MILCAALEKILGFSVEQCLMKVWPVTDLFCGGSHGIPLDERLRVDRPYGRVDRAVSQLTQEPSRTPGPSMLIIDGIYPSVAWMCMCVGCWMGRGGAGMCEQALKSELRRRAVEGGASLVKAAVDVNSVKHDAKVGWPAAWAGRRQSVSQWWREAWRRSRGEVRRFRWPDLFRDLVGGQGGRVGLRDDRLALYVW